jgi:Virulence factor/Scaffold protein Nfu/NifU N terminal/HEAT repeats
MISVGKRCRYNLHQHSSPVYDEYVGSSAPEVKVMKLCSIETTPSPNCIKLNLDQQISPKALTLQGGRADSPHSPEVAQKLLVIDGVKSVFLVGNFITLTKENSADWQPIIAKAAYLIGLTEDADCDLPAQVKLPEPVKKDSSSGQSLGQVEVAVQVFRGIPIQVRVTDEAEQVRVALPDRFNVALQRAIATTQANYIAERGWQPYEPRFGNPQEVAQMVADELASTIDHHELAQLEGAAISNQSRAAKTSDQPSQTDFIAELSHVDWGHRLKALQKIEVDAVTFPVIVAMLKDERSAIRRWAAAILGASGMLEAVEPLCQVLLSDSSAIVQRTAGDALSDLGDGRAIKTMCKALAARSKLVRWRAARFLNEIGNQTAVEALHRAAESEEEFDVRMEIVAAIERIEGGGKAQMPMWMRIARGSEQLETERE